MNKDEFEGDFLDEDIVEEDNLLSLQNDILEPLNLQERCQNALRMEWAQRDRSAAWFLKYSAIDLLMREDQARHELPAAWQKLLTLANCPEHLESEFAAKVDFAQRDYDVLKAYSEALDSSIRISPSGLSPSTPISTQTHLTGKTEELVHAPVSVSAQDQAGVNASTTEPDEQDKNDVPEKNAARNSVGVASSKSVKRTRTSQYALAAGIILPAVLAGYKIFADKTQLIADKTQLERRVQLISTELGQQIQIASEERNRAENYAQEVKKQLQLEQAERPTKQQTFRNNPPTFAVASAIPEKASAKIVQQNAHSQQDLQQNNKIGLTVDLANKFQSNFQRAGDNNEWSTQASPHYTAIKETLPEFRWAKGLSDENVTVQVFEKDKQDTVWESDEVPPTETTVLCGKPLARGRVYEWVLSTRSGPPLDLPRRVFYVLSEKEQKQFSSQWNLATSFEARSSVLARFRLLSGLQQLITETQENFSKKSRP